MDAFGKILSWAARNERRLGAVLFVAGFISDLLTFGLLPTGVVSWFFLVYLALAALCSLGSHVFPEARENASWWRRTLAVVFPLGAQYTLGNLLSGFVVFYTKNAALAASWPFILVLIVAYAGSEYFRKYKQYLVFQTTLFFLALYAYLIFALPLLVGRLGPWVFVGSTLAAILAFLLFLGVLRLANKARYLESRRAIVIAAVSILGLVNVAYFTGIIPPIPLAMKDGAAYHALMKVPGGYRVKTEGEQAWWDVRTPVVHLAPGELLYVYSAVAAPISFSSTVVHRWERNENGRWITESRIAFPISGGRAGGYRGYSERDAPLPGKWRVSVETPSGQVIGRIRFDIESVSEAPALQEITL